ncbi:MAG: hypothetical protein L0K86_08190 [Actinomycetia bacterium]|nr:hypothetical protein [Actinomycetes bacterium]
MRAQHSALGMPGNTIITHVEVFEDWRTVTDSYQSGGEVRLEAVDEAIRHLTNIRPEMAHRPTAPR